ncbi:hypothetical protein DFH06DRAFT_1129789 [Mycena polygramma]|nr:hypothetical protein DFH06DRAFT_1129789 [Mycena polygramma]
MNYRRPGTRKRDGGQREKKKSCVGQEARDNARGTSRDSGNRRCHKGSNPERHVVGQAAGFFEQDSAAPKRYNEAPSCWGALHRQKRGLQGLQLVEVGSGGGGIGGLDEEMACWTSAGARTGMGCWCCSPLLVLLPDGEDDMGVCVQPPGKGGPDSCLEPPSATTRNMLRRIQAQE